MQVNINVVDCNGNELEIGDFVDLYDWGYNSSNKLLGRVEIIFDDTTGTITCEPDLINDNYDFWSKALPKCKKVENTNYNRSYSEIKNQ
jgi:hypothetical protein